MSEIKKPVITKEQANSIENIRREGVLNDEDILRNHGKFTCTDACLNDLAFMTLAAALINGYEVDKTPEETIREYFKELSKDIQHYLEFGERKLAETKMEERATALKILDLLGMKVVGVDV